VRKKKKQSFRVTNDQEKAMFDFLNNHFDLSKGNHSVTATFTQHVATRNNGTDLLNSIPGPIKYRKALR